jgi:hypothetical protein
MFHFRMKKSAFLTLSVVLSLFAALVFPALIFPTLAHAQRDDDDDDDRPVARPALKPGEKPLDADFICPYTKDYQRPQQFGRFTLRMTVHPKTPEARCQATITSSKSHTAIVSDWALTVNPISGARVDHDGDPDVVIEGYSGGERCCFNYSVIALSEPPRVLRKIETRSPLTFEKQPDGNVVIRGADVSFDYFIIPHFAAVIPQVYLKLDGTRLLDDGAQFQAQYDKQIEEARGQLTQADLDKFRQSNYHQKMFTDQIPTVHRVLTIVLNYLYSGREAQAWQTLDEMWPASDRERVKNLILERRGRGLLSQLNTGSNASTAAKKGQ